MAIGAFEIRNYQVAPGMREHFIDYFEASFIPPLAALGADVFGQFRLEGEPDRFVWMRGFADMPARLSALDGFYSSPFWMQRRTVTNSMILDNDYVYLLRPLLDLDLLRGNSVEQVSAALEVGTMTVDTGVIAVDILHGTPGSRDALLSAVQIALPALNADGAQVRAVCGAELSENTYPRLPVLQPPDALVIITAYADDATATQRRAESVPPLRAACGTAITGITEWLLHPTLRSPLRYRP